MVINILVGMVAGGGGIISFVLAAAVFVGGHLFNAGINIFGAYVHSCRLQYIEFFGKFYEDGGKPFTPLAERSSYVYIRDV
jgi:V/A-type H+-transporting ATPase subunit I